MRKRNSLWTVMSYIIASISLTKSQSTKDLLITELPIFFSGIPFVRSLCYSCVHVYICVGFCAGGLIESIFFTSLSTTIG